ncbi:MAG TPA: hypothetical protein VNA12_01390, partial [Mycobacteriales bacterium]|nr:hypothetical protein [Mycobacteriales bacterium]
TPRRLVVQFADGTERSAPAQQVGPGVWEFALDLPADVALETISLTTTATGDLEIYVKVP